MIRKSDKFTLREKLALKILLLMLALTKPFEYSHEYTKAIKPIEDIINGKESLDD